MPTIDQVQTWHGRDAVAIYLSDPAIAGAFVARWCRAPRVETVEGAFQGDDAPTARKTAPLHRTPGEDGE